MRLALIFAVAARDWRLFWADPRTAVLGLTVPAAAAAAGFLLAGPRGFYGAALVGLLFTSAVRFRGQPRGAGLRVRAAAVPAYTVLLGNALTAATVGLLQVVVTFGFGYAVGLSPLAV